MTRKELCEMCTEYSAGTKCENKDTCKLQEILKENAALKVEVRKLKNRNSDLETRESWDMFPEAMGK